MGVFHFTSGFQRVGLAAGHRHARRRKGQRVGFLGSLGCSFSIIDRGFEPFPDWLFLPLAGQDAPAVKYIYVKT